ncbi:MAG TPA: colanic acid biosynthesis glycosyltransferase WcaL, partial [Chthoniobacterales bacterium]
MDKPLVASYCSIFLKREMRHLYRQVTGLRRYRTCVLAQERINGDSYPFPDIELLKKPRPHPFRHAARKFRGEPPLYYRGEADVLASVLRRRSPVLMHVYFGHIGVHLLPFIQRWPHPTIVSFHGMDAMPRNENPAYADKMRELLETVPLALARSESLARVLEERGAPKNRIRINRTALPL